MSVTIAERTGDQQEFYNKFADSIKNNMRVAMPGIIQSFDPVTQTVVVQPALKEKIRSSDLSVSDVQLPLLLDVPIVIPKAGGFALTLPIKLGDECLVIFSDMCIDNWWYAGGIQNQLEKRRHDLSDAFCILGTWSQPNLISNYSTNSAQLRSTDGVSYIDLKNNEIDMVSPTVKINGINFSNHTHSAPSGGGTTSGPS